MDSQWIDKYVDDYSLSIFKHTITVRRDDFAIFFEDFVIDIMDCKYR